VVAGRRARYLLLGFSMNAMLGTAYAWSVFTRPLKESFGATEFAAMLPFAVSLAMFSVGMVFAGRLVDRYGPRRIAILGGILVGSGYMLSSLVAVAPWPLGTLTLTYGVVVGVGIGFAYSPPIPTAVRWFPDRRGLASGIVVMGFGLSALFTAPLADSLLASTGLATTFLVLGCAFLVGLVSLGSLLAFPPETWRAPAPVRAARRTWSPLAEVDTRTIVRTRAFWSSWLLYALGTAGGFMVIGKAKDIALEVGHAAGALAVAAVMILAVFNSFGRPLFGRAADAYGPRRALLLLYLVLLGGMVLLSSSPSWVPLYVGIATVGMVFGGFLAVMPALATYFYGTRHLATNYGFLFTGYGTGALVALVTIGPIRDAFGSFVPAFYLGIGLSVAGLLLSLQVRPPRPATTRVEAARS
jgi:MFS family permease